MNEDLHGALEDARMSKLNRMAVVIQARVSISPCSFMRKKTNMVLNFVAVKN